MLSKLSILSQNKVIFVSFSWPDNLLVEKISCRTETDDESPFTSNEILIQTYCVSIDIMWGLTSGTFVIHCWVLARHSGVHLVYSAQLDVIQAHS